jgi:hypothetical protein
VLSSRKIIFTTQPRPKKKDKQGKTMNDIFEQNKNGDRSNFYRGFYLPFGGFLKHFGLLRLLFVAYCLLCGGLRISATADQSVKENFSFSDDFLQNIKRLPCFSTIRVSYVVEGHAENQTEWKLVKKVTLTWDVYNQKYRVTEFKSASKGTVDTRTYYCSDGKWSLIFGEYEDAGNLNTGKEIIAPKVSIMKSSGRPFHFPFSAFENNEEKLLNLSFLQARMPSKRSSNQEYVFFDDKKPYKDGSKYRGIFNFDKNGLLLGKTVARVNNNGEILFKSTECTILWDKNANLPTLFPKQVFVNSYGSGGKLTWQNRYTFLDLKINPKLSSEEFIPKYKLGAHVSDFLNNKFYTVVDKHYKPEAEMQKRLDALFIEAEKAKTQKNE